MYDIVTIGSSTIDTFIECDDANIVAVNTKNFKNEFMAYPYGAKVEIDGFKTAVGGGGVNAAVNLANLGFKTSAIFKIGRDFIGRTIKEKISSGNVDLSNIIVSDDEQSGFSIILVSFEGNRTVLAHRGANGNIKESDINFDAIKNAKWLYLAPLNGESAQVLDVISKFAEEHNVNTTINPGSSSLKKGLKYFKNILRTAEIVVMNKEEASLVTKIEVRPDTKEVKYSEQFIHPDILSMLDELKNMGAKIVLITDGKNGVYAADGNKYYKCPEFPAKVVSTLGAGDALSSTFTAAIQYTNWDVEKSLKMASVNAASVVSHFGAQEGFLSFEEIEKRLSESPCYRVETIKAV